MRASRLPAIAIVAGSIAVAAACGGATGGAGVDRPSAGAIASGDCRAVGGGEVTLAAEGLAFDTSCIEAPAGEAFTIVLDNRDGAPHNVTIEDGSGTAVFDGENVTRGTIAYEVPALDAGEYPFHCHVHPDMRGVVRVG